MPSGDLAEQGTRDGASVREGRPSVAIKTADSNKHESQLFYCVATVWGLVWGLRAAKLFRRLFEMVRSMIAPQLMHFQA